MHNNGGRSGVRSSSCTIISAILTLPACVVCLICLLCLLFIVIAQSQSMSMRRRQGGGGFKDENEGGISLGTRGNFATSDADTLSRRRNQEIPSAGGSGSPDSRSGSLERRGLLSSIDESL